MNVPNPIVWHASQMGILGNEVNPMHCSARKGAASPINGTPRVTVIV
jgi:hypothetical protein